MFGISWGEVALILAASAALFGPKDIVIIGRAAGRLTGKAVGYVQSARGQIDPLLQRSEINKVHKELRETMAQLDAIRHEMRTGISIMNPGPMTRQVMEKAVPGLSTAVQSHVNGATCKSDMVQSASIADNSDSGLFDTFSPTQMVMQLQKLRSEHCQQIPAKPLAIPSNQVSHDTGALVGLGAIVHPSGGHVLPGGSIKGSLSQDVVVLPISAVEAGILPPSEGPLSGGADIVFASIMERKVAFESKKFFEQGDT